jgi:hypothetical protein
MSRSNKQPMTATEWILKLKKNGVLIEGEKNGKSYLHLQTPCKVHLTDNAIKNLRESYQSDREKGGVLVAIPKRIKKVTHLTIDRVIFLTNVSKTPQNSYLPDSKKLSQALKDTYSGQTENSLSIRFHTHPTHSDNPMNEMLNYIFQCNTSEQDQLVSDTPVSVGDLKVLMPRSLVLCSGNLSDKMFIGLYNGLIAPIEFEGHRKDQTQKAMESIFKSLSEWTKEGNNKLWLVGGGIVLAFLIIRYNKVAIPLILMLVAMSPMFINDQHRAPKYFAHVTKGGVTIDLPG